MVTFLLLPSIIILFEPMIKYPLVPAPTDVSLIVKSVVNNTVKVVVVLLFVKLTGQSVPIEFHVLPSLVYSIEDVGKVCLNCILLQPI